MKKVLFVTFFGIILIAFVIRIVGYRDGDDVSTCVDSNESNIDSNKSSIYSIRSSSICTICYHGFSVVYNIKTLQPESVEYTLTAQQVWATDNTPKVSHHFMPDPNLSLPQASDEDYRGVNKLLGLSRGHMVPHQDMKWSLQSVQESDYYTNICPQNEKLNTKLWRKIENITRKLATLYDSVHVICGPIFNDTVYGFIGPNRIPVPDFFYKTLLVRNANGYHAIAFYCPNNNLPLNIFETICSVDNIESISNIDVYSFLPDDVESEIEKQISNIFFNNNIISSDSLKCN